MVSRGVVAGGGGSGGWEDTYGPYPLQLIVTCQNGPAEHEIGVCSPNPVSQPPQRETFMAPGYTVTHSFLCFLLLLNYLLLGCNMADTVCTFLPQSPFVGQPYFLLSGPLDVPDRAAHPPNPFAKVQNCLEEASEQEG